MLSGMDIGLHNSCNWAWNAYGKSSTDIYDAFYVNENELTKIKTVKLS